MIKISVVTVCFNSAKTIEQTIRSVINQSYKNIEYVVIDGGSKDGTIDIIKKYEAYISYWVSEPDEGIYDAMNKGIKVATGEVIAFLNSDDWYCEDILKRCAEQYACRQSDVLYGDMVVVASDGAKLRHLSCNEADFENIFYKTVIYHPSTFVRTSILKKRLFNTKYKICADQDLFVELYIRGCSFCYLGKEYYTNFRLGGCSNTSTLVCSKELYSVGKKYLKYCKRKDTYTEIKTKLDIIGMYNFLIEIQDCLDDKLKHRIIQLCGEKQYDKVIVFGAGNVGKVICKLLDECGINFDVVDNNKDVQEKGYFGKKVKAPEVLHGINNILVLIANSGDTKGMVQQLQSLGLKEKKDFFDFHDWCKYLILLKYNRLCY